MALVSWQWASSARLLGTGADLSFRSVTLKKHVEEQCSAVCDVSPNIQLLPQASSLSHVVPACEGSLMAH